MAGATLGIQKLSNVSANPFVGGVQQGVISAIVPGMLGAMVVDNNVHAWNLGLAAAINGAIYFTAAWGILALANRFWHLR
jgi:uncharacterized membrane protein YeaQ/YmgE (transglycosylase-associated protein family)